METVSVGVNERLFVIRDTGRLEVPEGTYFYVLIGSPDGAIRTAARIPVAAGSYDGPGLAAALQVLMRQYTDSAVPPQTATVSYDSGALTFYDPAGGGIHYLLPSGRQLRDPAWKAQTWDTAQHLWQPAYSVDAPADLNRMLGLSYGTAFLSPFRTGQLATRVASVLPVPPAQYGGPQLAAALQAVLQTVVPSASVGFGAEGRLAIASDIPLQFPTDVELRDGGWRGAQWDPYDDLQQPYDTTYPRDLNGQLFFPSPSALALRTVSGNIDLAPYREVYLHSSLSNNLTLKTTGERDCIARIPIDVDYGYVVSFRHLGPSDALSSSDAHFRNVSFSFRDWRGQLVPIDQPVAIELVIVDSDPFNQ
jgi:hypothetical protein